MIVPVILSGGSGTRLWPLSRERHPKQLLQLAGRNTLLQETVLRLSGISGMSAPLIVCNENHRFIIAEQMRQINIKPSAVMLEPLGRNTAPAAAAAALHASGKGRDPVIILLPADHLIRDTKSFHAALTEGIRYARTGNLITFGIAPDRPETGYGYIKKGKRLSAPDFGAKKTSVSAYKVERFEEKPDSAKAGRFVRSGDYLWNSGIFMFRASVFLEELKKHAPDILGACRDAVKGASNDYDFLRLEPKAFSACRADSIDYAVMEKTASAAVIPLSAGWSDVGSWSSLWEVLPKDMDGNSLSGDVMAEDVKDSFIYAGSRLVSAIGIKDSIIVETADAVLVTDMKHAQKIKRIVEELRKQGRDEALTHRKVNRPWGTFECIDIADRFQVKRITVNPGAGLSLQRHVHRAEHWIVVKGTAKVTRNRKIMTVNENESTYIPPGTRHRLENPGKIPLELIEVQSGSYLGEDDIERFDDRYGRTG